jgi:hypothetical protein
MLYCWTRNKMKAEKNMEADKKILEQLGIALKK